MFKPVDTEWLATAGASLTKQSAARLFKLFEEWKERQAEGQAEVEPPSAVGGVGATADGVHSRGARPDAPGAEQCPVAPVQASVAAEQASVASVAAQPPLEAAGDAALHLVDAHENGSGSSQKTPFRPYVTLHSPHTSPDVFFHMYPSLRCGLSAGSHSPATPACSLGERGSGEQRHHARPSGDEPSATRLVAPPRDGFAGALPLPIRRGNARLDRGGSQQQERDGDQQQSPRTHGGKSHTFILPTILPVHVTPHFPICHRNEFVPFPAATESSSE